MSTTTLAHADAAARLRLAIARLSRQLRQQNVGDLTLSQWSALVTVELHGRLRIGDIADREGVSAPTATRLVASLEERGLLQRETDASDRRSSHVFITDAGRGQLEEFRQASTAKLARRLSVLAQSDVSRLLDVLPLLEELAAED
ncbi:MAG TPA: MarR family transcriptional regulator [Mycobacteriales bacterium]|nr:MarR family transcriptional regulator [Mycobacteriales bacterium]